MEYLRIEPYNRHGVHGAPLRCSPCPRILPDTKVSEAYLEARRRL